MKKPIIYFLSALVIGSVTLTSCDKEDDRPVKENDIQNGFVKVSLSVQVVPSSITTASTKKVAGLSKAKVTVSQGSDKKVIEVDESGIAVFPNLYEGYVSIYVEAEGYASYNTSTYLEYEGSLDIDDQGIDSEVPGFSQLSIELPRLAATLKGTIIGDWELDGGDLTALTASGAKILARTSSEFQPSIYPGTLNNGIITFEGLPENVEIDLSLDYTSVHTAPNPDETLDWEININNIRLKADETKQLGNIVASPL